MLPPSASPAPAAAPVSVPAPAASGEELAAWMQSLPNSDAACAVLLDLLEESHPVYHGRSGYTVVWLRGFILMALTRRGLPPGAWPFILEELQNGRDAYLVAVAAAAVRAMPVPPQGIGALLVKALQNICLNDDTVCLESWRGRPPLGAAPGTTAVAEILASLRSLGSITEDAAGPLRQWLTAGRSGLSPQFSARLQEVLGHLEAGDRPPQARGSATSCCAGTLPRASFLRRLRAALPADPLAGLTLEDQSGATLDCRTWLHGMPAVLAFFYTRCDNPDKCSLTISKLAALQRELARRGLEQQVRLAAFTYDPAFDHPPRLRAYGLNRGFQFGPHARFFRTPGGIEPLQSAFSLGVNFVGTMVNRHRIELCLLNRHGTLVGSFERLAWDEQDVAIEAAALAGPDLENPRESETTPRSTVAGTRPLTARLASGFLSALAPLGLALFPKCPACLAAWFSVLGIGGLHTLPSGDWMKGLLLAAMAFQLLWIARRYHHGASRLPLLLSTTGMALVLAAAWLGVSALASLTGIAAISISSILATRGTASLSLTAPEKSGANF